MGHTIFRDAFPKVFYALILAHKVSLSGFDPLATSVTSQQLSSLILKIPAVSPTSPQSLLQTIIK